MSQWEEVLPGPDGEPALDSAAWDTDDDSTPFGGIERVDGLVYTDEAISPELQWSQQQTKSPALPVRQRPQPATPQRFEPWKPGPDPVPPTAKQASPIWRMAAVLIVPTLFLAGLAFVVSRVMNAYGL